MILDSKRTKALEAIERSIEKHGFHVYMVEQHSTPRFAYTIGLSKTLGVELLLAGAIGFYGDDVVAIVHAVRDVLARRGAQSLGAPSDHIIPVANYGEFTLRAVHDSWCELLLAGASDFYGPTIGAYQIVPDKAHSTIDVPDTSEPWSAHTAPVWRWLREPWPYSFPEESTATTNLAALRGERVTEVARWEPDEWDMFAGPGPDVTEEEMRVVPVTCLVAADPSLAPVLSLDVGKALWRDDLAGDFNVWQKSK